MTADRVAEVAEQMVALEEPEYLGRVIMVVPVVLVTADRAAEELVRQERLEHCMVVMVETE
jgi:hypothetical protein